MTFVKKGKVIGLTVIFLAIFGVTMLCLAQLGEDGIPRLDKSKRYVKEYVVGQEGIKGTVNMSYMGNDPSYEIVADKDGNAVFKNPEKAFSQMKIDLYKGLEAIKEREIPTLDRQ